MLRKGSFRPPWLWEEKLAKRFPGVSVLFAVMGIDDTKMAGNGSPLSAMSSDDSFF